MTSQIPGCEFQSLSGRLYMRSFHKMIVFVIYIETTGAWRLWKSDESLLYMQEQGQGDPFDPVVTYSKEQRHL